MAEALQPQWKLTGRMVTEPGLSGQKLIRWALGPSLKAIQIKNIFLFQRPVFCFRRVTFSFLRAQLGGIL